MKIHESKYVLLPERSVLSNNKKDLGKLFLTKDDSNLEHNTSYIWNRTLYIVAFLRYFADVIKAANKNMHSPNLFAVFLLK